MVFVFFGVERFEVSREDEFVVFFIAGRRGKAVGRTGYVSFREGVFRFVGRLGVGG